METEKSLFNIYIYFPIISQQNLQCLLKWLLLGFDFQHLVPLLVTALQIFY